MTNETTLRIRGMVCARCIGVVQAELSQLGVPVLDIQLGTVTVGGSLQPDELTRIESALTRQGFSLIQESNRTGESVHQRAKVFVDQYFEQDDLSETNIGQPNRRLSGLLQAGLGLDYDTISGQFSRAEGITLEKYVINRRIDKVKEQLVYSDLSLTDIAYRTGYSSVQHLSNQFRQQTGLTPSYFRQIRQQKQAVQQGVD